MRIPDYKKRAARAVEKWKRLQVQKRTEENDIRKEDSLIKRFQKNIPKEKRNPMTLVKGIKIKEKIIKKAKSQELRDIA